MTSRQLAPQTVVWPLPETRATVLSYTVAPPIASERVRPTIWLDITDLFFYAMDGNTTVSGIQRVVANLIMHASLAGARVAPVVPEFDNFRVLEPDFAAVRDLVEVLQAGGSTREAVQRHVAAVADSRREVAPVSGDVVLIPGAFWIHADYDLLMRLRARGITVALFVHDLIQINNPEYVHEDANRVFRERLIDVLGIVDFVLTNSEFVAGDLRRYMAERLDLTLPVRAVTLPTELPAVAPTETALPADLLRVARTDYVLCVGTIEIRKNHRYLVDLWERLFRDYRGAVPNLVFVGKWGWKIDELRQEIEGGDAVGRWLFVFNDLSDAGLDHLYENCLFTAYVSFAEGFGLPVGESLAHGKPCIASNVTSIPEVGGDFVRYVNPLDLDQGYDTVAAVLDDREALARWAARIRREFTPKTWTTFCGELYGVVDAFARLPAGAGAPDARSAGADPGHEGGTRRLNYTLPSGRLVFAGGDDVQRLDARGEPLLTFRMARLKGWHPVESWGVWAAERFARLRFPSDMAAGTAVRMAFRLRMPGLDAASQALSVRIGDVETRLHPLLNQDSYAWADGVVSAGGVIDIALVCHGKPPHTDDTRVLYVGLSALAACRADDLSERQGLLEEIAGDLSRGQDGAGPAGRASASSRAEMVEGAVLRRLLVGGLAGPRPTGLTRLWGRVAIWRARRAARKHLFACAERRYADALRRDPSRASTWIQYGHMVLEQGDLDAATDAYRVATKAEPEHADGFLHLGLALERAGCLRDAQPMLAQAARLGAAGG